MTDSPNKSLLYSGLVVSWVFVAISVYLSSNALYNYMMDQLSWMKSSSAVLVAIIAIIAFSGGAAIDLMQRYSAIAMGYNSTRPRDYENALKLFALAIVINLASMSFGLHRHLVLYELSQTDAIVQKDILNDTISKIEKLEVKLDKDDTFYRKLQDGATNTDLANVIVEQKHRNYNKMLLEIKEWKKREIKLKVRKSHEQEDMRWIENQYQRKILQAKASLADGSTDIASFNLNRNKNMSAIKTDIDTTSIEIEALKDKRNKLKVSIAKGAAISSDRDWFLWKISTGVSSFVIFIVATLNFFLGLQQRTVHREERRATSRTSYDYIKTNVKEEIKDIAEDISSLVPDTKSVFLKIKALSKQLNITDETGNILRATSEYLTDNGIHPRKQSEAMKYGLNNNLIRKNQDNKYYFL